MQKSLMIKVRRFTTGSPNQISGTAGVLRDSVNAGRGEGDLEIMTPYLESEALRKKLSAWSTTCLTGCEVSLNGYTYADSLP